MPPFGTAIDEFVRKGRMAPDQRTSASTIWCPDKLRQIYSLYNQGLQGQERTMLLLDSSVVSQYVFCGADRSLNILTCPKLVTSAGTSIIIGSLGDVISDINPISLPLADFRNRAAVLVSKGFATQYDCPTHPVGPDQIGGPAPAEDAPPVDPSFERLHWTPSSPSADDLPVIALLPVCMPWPPGLPFPSDAKLDDDFSDEDAKYPPFAEHRRAWQHLIDHNGAVSVLHGTMFRLGDQQDQLDAAVLEAFPPLTDSVLPTITTLPAMTPEYRRVKVVAGDAAKAAHMRLGTEMPTTSPETNPLPNNTDTIAAALTEALKSSKSQKDTENAEKAAVSASFFQLLTASTNAEGQMELGVLHPEFLKIIKLSNNQQAMDAMQARLAARQRETAGSDNAFDERVQYPKNAIGLLLCTFLRAGKFLDESANKEPELCKHLANFYTFGRPQTNSVAFKAAVTQGMLSSIQEIVDEHQSKRAIKATELPLTCAMRDLHDVRVAIANLRFFFSIVVTNFDRSALWQAFKHYDAFLKDTKTSHFCNMFRDEPQVVLNLFTLGQDILALFVTIANMSDLQSAVQNKQPIDGGVFKQAARMTDRLMDRPQSDVYACTLRELGIVAQSASLFPHLRIKKDATFGSGQSPQDHVKANSKRSRTDDKPGESRDKRQAAASDIAKTKGFLVWSGPGNPPQLEVFYDHSGRNARLCAPFICQGAACPRKHCTSHHPTSVNGMPQKAREHLTKTVSVTDGLEFAPNGAPAGKPSAPA